MQTFCGLTTDGMLDYLVAIYKLRDEKIKVTTSLLAERMHVSPAATSNMLKRLRESGFVARYGTGGVALSEQGRLAALQTIRRHRLLEVFLINVMGYTWDQVDNEAHRLEHAISMTFEDRMDHLSGYPTHCPHGDPIPRKDGTMPNERLIPLTGMTAGQEGVLRRTAAKEPTVLRYLARLHLTPGQKVKMIEQAPFNGPITVELPALPAMEPAAVETQILGNELATQLFVEVHGA